MSQESNWPARLWAAVFAVAIMFGAARLGAWAWDCWERCRGPVVTNHDQPQVGLVGNIQPPSPLQITNVAVQDICPNDSSEHLALGSYDPVTWALLLDALDEESLSAQRALTIPFVRSVLHERGVLTDDSEKS